MDLLGCAAVRPKVPAYYDGELSVEDQIAVDTHLASCAACAAEARRLDAIGDALRAGPAAGDSARRETAGFVATVVSHLIAERDQSPRARLGRLFEDMHLVWAGLVATTATAACVAIITGLLGYASPERAASLSAIMTAMATPGSNANPVRLHRRIQVPRVDPAWVMPAMLVGPDLGQEDSVFALLAVLTQEGRISEFEVLLTAGHDRERMLDLLSVTSVARFEPASFAGAPVAVNLIWLLTHTTVRGELNS